jgi:DnaJ-class molecular chaperone
MNDIDFFNDYENDSCEGDRYDREQPCPKCKGTGKIALFTSVVDCAYCEGTGIDLHAAGYYDGPQTD